MAPGKTHDEAIARIDAVVKSVIDSGVTAAEVDKARNQALALTARGLTTNNDRAIQVLVYELLDGDYNRLFKLAESYDKVTAEDVQRVARASLTPKNRTVALLVPKAGENANEEEKP